jgi:putative pyruvate formate lyase activating enzyme
LAKKYSNVGNYFEVATSAIQEMYKQVGKIKFDENGTITRGVVIRHLILPNNIENTKKVLKWIDLNMPKDILVSVMAQYFPTFKANDILELNRKITRKEYKKVEEYLYKLNIQNGYIQEIGKNEQNYVPKWEINI